MHGEDRTTSPSALWYPLSIPRLLIKDNSTLISEQALSVDCCHPQLACQHCPWILVGFYTCPNLELQLSLATCFQNPRKWLHSLWLSLLKNSPAPQHQCWSGPCLLRHGKGFQLIGAVGRIKLFWINQWISTAKCANWGVFSDCNYTHLSKDFQSPRNGASSNKSQKYHMTSDSSLCSGWTQLLHLPSCLPHFILH